MAYAPSRLATDYRRTSDDDDFRVRLVVFGCGTAAAGVSAPVAVLGGCSCWLASASVLFGAVFAAGALSIPFWVSSDILHLQLIYDCPTRARHAYGLQFEGRRAAGSA